MWRSAQTASTFFVLITAFEKSGEKIRISLKVGCNPAFLALRTKKELLVPKMLSFDRYASRADTCMAVDRKASMLRNDISRTLALYARQFPGDEQDVAALHQLIADGGNVTSRREFRGHVTCGAALVSENGELLMIRHRALNMWLFPGGHVEKTDATLRETAIREVAEETGVTPLDLSRFEGWTCDMPLYFDAHPIPENTEKGEPQHLHFCFVYLFRVAPCCFSLQTGEVTDWAWKNAAHVPRAVSVRLNALGIP